MKDTVKTDATEASAATALSKRKASEPFFYSIGEERVV
ncbi:hypothetical protein M472_12635 [Sphingobacterium paucimobilis HER1398]|uniref:Uncharacterized protein n=1 Tax=Sphingobacterium paucimobilis HER1398 TaxID=1346330 RepID=U2J3W6_9SPHI|nr:hypothetical protein M472_12635 [Sphingobacterium paucimobilis HER1398]